MNGINIREARYFLLNYRQNTLNITIFVSKFCRNGGRKTPEYVWEIQIQLFSQTQTTVSLIVYCYASSHHPTVIETPNRHSRSL